MAAVEDLQRRADAESVALTAQQLELSHWKATETYDSVVSIGLLMFFGCDQADAILAEMQHATARGGILALNVLTAGTTYTEMFEPGEYCLLAPEELLDRFSKWRVLESRIQDFPVNDACIKRFVTVVAERPAS